MRGFASVPLDGKAATILDRIHAAKDLFVPADHSIERLEDVHPVVSARFIVHRLDQPSVQLEIETDKMSSIGDFHEVRQSRWCRSDGKDIQVPLSVSSIQLDGYD